MVRKRFDIRNDQRGKHLIEKEVRILKRLPHPHIVKFVDMYEEDPGTSKHRIYVLMYPVGDNDLRAFLHDALPFISKRTEPEFSRFTNYLQTWYCCLAAALAFLHKEGIRHDDIKPSNIIQKNGMVYFTDFGSSREVFLEDTTSTAEPALATRLFAAPEAMMGPDGETYRHGSQSDAFSLGPVFMKMLWTTMGAPEPLRKSVEKRSGSTFYQYHTVLDWFDTLMSENGQEQIMYWQCIKTMLASERQLRPQADTVLRSVYSSLTASQIQACICPLRHHQDESGCHGT